MHHNCLLQTQEVIDMTYTKPTAVGDMTQEELDAELRKGIESIKEGKTFTADEVDQELKKEFGI